MTDQNTPAVTDEDRRLAYEWAKSVESNTLPWTDRIRAAARVILDAVPTPAPPTLADMTPDERHVFQWMQADVKGRIGRYVIATPSDRNGLAGLVSADGVIEWTYPERVTPRPDLPRLEWPGTGQGVEDVPPAKVGDIVESADDPRLDALPVGSVLLDRDGVTTTKREEGRWAGFGHKPIPSQGDEYGPWTVRRIGLVADQ